MAPPKNPIEKRFDKLAELWTEFAENDDARLLRWLPDHDSLRMIDLFVELQNEEVSEIPDLFVRFSDPFSEGPDYSSTLVRSLAEKYDEIQQDIAEEGIPAEWQPPTSDVFTTEKVVETFTSFQQAYASIMEHFVAVLVPENSHQLGGSWHAWLSELLSLEIPPSVRFMVIDDAESPVLTELAEQNPERVLSIAPELDMPGAYEQIAAEAPGSGPGHDFRQLYVKLNNAAGKGDLESAKTAGERAIVIAAENNWPYLVTAAQMALAAAYLGAGQIADTIACYQAANAAVAGSEDPAEQKLDVQTRMAEGSAHIADEQYGTAADVFADAAPLAEKTDDATSHLECSRMAGYCFEVDGQAEEAWQWGQQAVDVGAAMTAEDREASTLPYAGQMLIRLADNGTNADQKQDVQDRMEQLLGAEWEQTLEEAAS
ncbi:MAG: hypothetical protein GY758_12030 [Fuerstiella sp.]|nr:hypothetical protein [Fuerstiella sp.]MCP4506361.1 hypothetical protein [Fuerstiella sp.]